MNSKTYLLIAVLLVVASFFAGLSWTKIGKDGNNTAQVSPQPSAQQQANQATQPQVLGVSAMNQLVTGGVVLGSKNAKVTVVEFSDPSCPY